MVSFDTGRLAVSIVDVYEGGAAEFRTVAADIDAMLTRKNYGRTDVVPDEATPLRSYIVYYWNDAAAAAACHADPDAQALTARLYRIGRVIHVVNGVRRTDPLRLTLDDRRARIEADRRTGFDRRSGRHIRVQIEQRGDRDRRLRPRRLRDRTDIDLVGAARRAREHADAAFSHFKVGAALETADGAVITGCNIENATYGLTICAERVAMFKALSEGHRAFTRIAIVADTEAPTPPCGACRQILWEFGGNLEILLANLEADKGTHRLKDLLPLPFDARLL